MPSMRIGIIGFGFMGGVHLSAIEQIKDATVVAVASRTRPAPNAPARGNLPQLQSGALPDTVHWYGDWHQLVQDPEVDAVDICLPTHLHQEVAIAALQQGKHVLCEKPLSLTAEACDQILASAQKSGRTFMVGHVLRFMYPYQYLASFIHETCHDDIVSCTLRRETGYPQWSEWLASENGSGGAILDLLCHDIDMAIHLFGKPTSVSAVSQGAIDTMSGTLHYAKGHSVRIEGGWRDPEIPFSAGFEVTAKNASLVFAESALRQTISGEEKQIVIPEHHEYTDQVAYFVKCCQMKAPPTLCPPEESSLAVKVALLLKESRNRNGEEIACAL